MSTQTQTDDFNVDDPELTRFDLVREGARRDGVEIVHYAPRFPVPGTVRERRTVRAIGFMFTLAGLLGLAFVVAYIWWPWSYETGLNIHKLYTPILGVTMGLSLAFIGIGMITWGKKLLPDEISVQERHEHIDQAERKITGETMLNMVDELGVKRRPLLGMAALAGMAPLGLVLGAPWIGGLIKQPHPKGDDPYTTTAWNPNLNGELHGGAGTLVAVTRDDGTKIRPEDISVGGQMTVFPGLVDPVSGEFVGSSNDYATSPTLLIHLRDKDADELRSNLKNVKVNQHGVNGTPNVWGNYVAYSKICTHAGCPASLYEQQTNRLLCPCHQSQFNIVDNARPIFGPATRRLPMLPLTVGDDGYFYAAGDYQVPVGPGFWERP
jgi:ubiquinol-cytochrome c reductase iron-sulfur subunit